MHLKYITELLFQKVHKFNFSSFRPSVDHASFTPPKMPLPTGPMRYDNEASWINVF